MLRVTTNQTICTKCPQNSFQKQPKDTFKYPTILYIISIASIDCLYRLSGLSGLTRSEKKDTSINSFESSSIEIWKNCETYCVRICIFCKNKEKYLEEKKRADEISKSVAKCGLKSQCIVFLFQIVDLCSTSLFRFYIYV